MRKNLAFIIISAILVIGLAGLAVALPGVQVTDPAFISNLGYHAYQEGELGLAERLFRTAIALDPSYERARLNLATLLNEQGEYDAAAAELQELVALDPEQAQYWYDLGVNLIADFRFGDRELTDFKDGITAYERAAAIDPAYAHVQENLAVLYSIREEYGI